MNLPNGSKPEPNPQRSVFDEHFEAKVREAVLKFGPEKAKPIVAITQKTVMDLGAINASKSEVQFLLDWINEVIAIMDVQAAEQAKPKIVLPPSFGR